MKFFKNFLVVVYFFQSVISFATPDNSPVKNVDNTVDNTTSNSNLVKRKLDFDTTTTSSSFFNHKKMKYDQLAQNIISSTKGTVNEEIGKKIVKKIKENKNIENNQSPAMASKKGLIETALNLKTTQTPSQIGIGASRELLNTVVLGLTPESQENDNNYDASSLQNLIRNLDTSLTFDNSLTLSQKKNQKIFEVFSTKDLATLNLINVSKKLFDNLPNDKKLAFNAVDIDHVEKPTIDRKDGVIKQVSGGHSLKRYARADVQETFLRDSSGVYAIKFNNTDIVKTVLPDFESSTILNLGTKPENSEFVAKASETKNKKGEVVSRSEIRKDGTGKYYGFYYDTTVYVPLVSTLFPIFTIVDSANADQIFVGRLDKFEDNALKLDFNKGQQDVFISRKDFNDVIAQGKALDSDNNLSERVVDITEPMNRFFEANGFTFKNLPVYAVIPK